MDIKNCNLLINALEEVPQAPYPFESRVHPLQSFPGTCFVKRDDELGFAISGSKIRKFRTLIPWLVKEEVHTALVIGGSHSNNVLGIVQLLIENRIKPVLFLKNNSRRHLQGNFLFISLFVSEDAIHWIAEEEWPLVKSRAEEYAKSLNEEGKKAYVIVEGSALPISLLGAMTLPFDIMRNENQLDIVFDNIFIDAGTGLSAAALLLVFAWIRRSTKIFVVLIAGCEKQFIKSLRIYHAFFQDWLAYSFSFPDNYEILLPPFAKSFGSVNGAVLKAIKTLAKEEGFLCDPIYSAKLFMTAKTFLETKEVDGNHLLIHSGGALTLSGYQQMLKYNDR